VDVKMQTSGGHCVVVHRADAHEAHGHPGAKVVAPDRNLADQQRSDALSFAACRLSHDNLALGCKVLDPAQSHSAH
jgi:hypothetical protein